jgi:hypothetical protein
MTTKVKYTILIVCAGLVGAATEAAGLFPNVKELLAAASIFLGAVMIFIGNQKAPTA